MSLQQRNGATVKRLIILGVLLLASLGFAPASALAAPASPATHATHAIASVVPSGCVATFSPTLDTFDGSGTLVGNNVVSASGAFDWTGSGASVALSNVALHSTDGHTYTISSVHWEGGPSGLVYRGPGGNFTSTPWSWTPSPKNYIVNAGGPIGPYPAVRVHFYDANRPAVGGTLDQLTCP